MNTFFKIVILNAIITFFSCEKSNPGNEDIKKNVDFNVNLELSALTCYPDDSILMTFRINSTNGIAPYMYNWINPDSLVGGGPFTVGLKSNLVLNGEVFDADSNKMEFHYEVLRDTIDFLEFDYRNRVVGLYDCRVVYRATTQDILGNFITHETIYQDTIEVSKHSEFKMLKISNLPDVNYNFKDLSFEAYHTSGHFKADSISLYYFQTPVGLYNWTYKGKKLN
jgi:hypothetical protein